MTTLPMDPAPGVGRAGYPFDNDFFTLGAPVGPDQPNRREDVIKIETILGNTGHHDLARTDGPLGFWGERSEQAVKSWQGENGLKVDGLLKPGGPTITSLKKATGGLLGGFKPPSPDEVDEHHARLQQGEPALLNIRPARLSLAKPPQPVELDEASLAFNADSARALTRSSVDGDVPRIYADYVKQAGVPGAHPTVMDLVEQVNATSGRDRADRVLHGIVGQLPAEQAKALLGGVPPAKRPLGVRAADLPDDDKVPLFRAAAVAEGAKPVQVAAVDTGTKTDAEPQRTSTGEQVALAPAVAIGGAALAAGTAAVLSKQLPEAVETTRKWWENRQQPAAEGANGQGQQTTIADPQAGKVLPGAAPSTPQIQQGTPPSQQPKPIPPVPPSTQQKPSATGNSYPGQPAEPVKPMGPLDIRARPPVDLGKGGKPYLDTEEAIAGIPDKKAQDAVRGVMLGSGVTNGADKRGTHVVVEGGDFETAKQDHGKLVSGLGIDPASVRKRPDGGLEATSPNGQIEVIARPSSGRDEPTLEVQKKDGKDVTHRFKRRYGRQNN